MFLKIMKWNDPPAMDIGAPEPLIKECGGTLWCAYRCANPGFPGWDSGESIGCPGFDEYFALLEFTGVEKFTLGPPSDDNLHKHPLYRRGIRRYGFYILLDSLELRPYIGRYLWVVTFHDETLQVIAKEARVKSYRIEAISSQAAIECYAGKIPPCRRHALLS